MSQTPHETNWPGRVAKAAKRLRSGDLSGLGHDVAEFLAWQRGKGQPDHGEAAPLQRGNPEAVRAQAAPSQLVESEYWDQFDKELNRQVYWASAADFGPWALEKMAGRPVGPIDLILELMGAQNDQPHRGLALGCGDMKAEHEMFLDPRLPFIEIDAYDVSPSSMEQARELTEKKGLRVKYAVADSNELELPDEHYALIVVFHAYHHFERVDRVAQQINRALTRNGVFYTVDYVGPRYLQYSDRQLYYAQHFLSLLPPGHRRELDGTIREAVAAPSPAILSPDEAICSDLILPALAKRLAVRWQYNFAGLLFPLLDGIAFNFTRNKRDQALMRFLFGVDHALCASGEVEPSFTITFAQKKA